MITDEQKEAQEAVDMVKMMIVEQAEKAFQKFDILTADEDLRNAMISYMTLHMNKFCYPENPKTEAAIQIVERSMVNFMIDPKKNSTKLIIDPRRLKK